MVRSKRVGMTRYHGDETVAIGLVLEAHTLSGIESLTSDAILPSMPKIWQIYDLKL